MTLPGWKYWGKSNKLYVFAELQNFCSCSSCKQSNGCKFKQLECTSITIYNIFVILGVCTHYIHYTCTDQWPLTTEIVVMNFKLFICLYPVWLSRLLWALKSVVGVFCDCLTFFFLQLCGLQSNWLIRCVFYFWVVEIFYADF